MLYQRLLGLADPLLQAGARARVGWLPVMLAGCGRVPRPSATLRGRRGRLRVRRAGLAAGVACRGPLPLDGLAPGMLSLAAPAWRAGVPLPSRAGIQDTLATPASPAWRAGVAVPARAGIQDLLADPARPAPAGVPVPSRAVSQEPPARRP